MLPRCVGAVRTVALLLVVGVAEANAQCPDGSPPPCGRGTVERPSIAVLYFENQSRDTTDAYLAAGVTEEIIARLAQVERISVKSRTVVNRYRNRAGDVLAIGRALGVTHLLSGTVRRGAGTLRVSAELVRTSNGDRVWGERYDRADGDMLIIEEDIARAVAGAVAGRLLPIERASLATRRTSNAVAYDRYLRGNYLLSRRTPANAIQAIREYEGALARDPGFTRALSRIALAYALFFDWEWDYPGLPPDSLHARGLAASESALRRDDRDAEAWSAQSYLLMHRSPRTHEGVASALRRALELDSTGVDVVSQAAWFELLEGRDSAAAAMFHRALQLEPERASTMYQLARIEQLAGRLHAARRWLDSAIAIEPGSYFSYGQRGQVRLLLGDVVGARRDGEIALQLSPPDYRPYRIRGQMLLARADLQAGDTASGRARLHRLLAEEATDRPTVLEGWYLAMALVAFGELDAAVQFLERVQPRGAKLWFGLRMPEFDALRAHSGFQRIVAESRPPTGNSP